ncbi:MAG: hypothetical protein JKX88_10665 [Marinicaulis sp.]|nr:hypothetical protein [Marinicaulis sp.]
MSSETKVESAKTSLERKLDIAVEEWVSDELKSVSKRNFELAKFFFAVSAATLGLLPISEGAVIPRNVCEVIGLLLVSFSIFLAICIAEPADFKVNAATDPYREHKKYARSGKVMRYTWFVTWVVGVILYLLGAAGQN